MSASPPAAAAAAASPSSSPPAASSGQLPQGTLQPGGVYSQRFVAETFHVKYEGVLIPMRDGVQLSGDLYLPAVEGKPDETLQFPCVLIRTPYNKGAENPDLRSPGNYWTQNGYSCFIQDVRGRFKSAGYFYKYTGEAADGYDTVEWLAVQPWCNGSICTDGPSYLCHVQTSMAILRPPHLKAMMANKGGFFNAHTSGVRNGGAYEARQWVWGVKNAPRKDPVVKAALEEVEKNFGAWMKRYPFKRGDSPLSSVPDYENFIFDQAGDMSYASPYWKQIGLNTEEYLDEFMDIPALWMSGWYDIYCRSTIDFFVSLSARKKGPHLLIMGPWQHVGPEGHVAGDVDFGVNALISGNLAPTVPSLARRWFDRFVTPATARAPRKLTPHEKLQMVISAAEEQQQQQQQRAASRASGDFLAAPATVRGPYTSLSRIPASLTASNSAENLARGPSMYLLPSSLPKEPRRGEDDGPLPPAVRYFRMGGGDGHKTSQGCMMHGGVWMAANSWPPAGTKEVSYYLGKRTLTPGIYDKIVHGNEQAATSRDETSSSSSNRSIPHATAEGEGETGELASKVSGLDLRGEGESSSSTADGPAASSSSSSAAASPYRFRSHTPPAALRSSSTHVTTFDYDPRKPVPSIGGNVFGYKDVLLAGAFNQVERPGHFLCDPPFLPLSSRPDVIVFRTPVLSAPLDVTGMIVVHLIVSSSAVDTDFTAKVLDEYPPSADYPAGYAMQITHGIRRARFRDSRSEASLMVPGQAYALSIELYPTSNLFAAGHRLRLDISSSNFPHFDTNRNTGEDFESGRTVVAQNSVWHHEAYPSRVVLPIQTKAQLQNEGGRMSEAGR